MIPASRTGETVLPAEEGVAEDEAPSPESPPPPGQEVRWHHPRLALALGRFHTYGPGPFEVVAVGVRGSSGAPLTLVIKTAFGEREIDAAWVGPAIAAGAGRTSGT
jgi:hypothetical protein